MEEKNKVICDQHWWRGDKTFGKRICARCGQYKGEETPQSPAPQSVDNEGVLDSLIKGIHINDANFDYCAKNKVINGTLYLEIKRITKSYSSELRKENEELRKQVEALEKLLRAYTRKNELPNI